ncbi:MAG: hypothetical protein EXS25_00195 [Pedosphaera sp.]|nr:hypothetical protein [Pedosphaera sp.]
MLSGKNTFRGPTTVKQGTLSLSDSHSLAANTEVTIAPDAMLGLNFKGQMNLRQLTLNGKIQSRGTYDAASTPRFLKGSGTLYVQP